MAQKRTKRQALARRARQNLATMPTEPGILGVFQRLATDPKLTVDKLGELIKLQERIMDREAAAAFETAYKLMLPEIPRITKRGRIKNKQGEVQSRYSKYEDIRKVTDPILQRFGFTMHYQTLWPVPGTAEIVGTLVHERGGTMVSRFQSRADDSGGKNAIQGLGSAVTYGKRYVRKDLLAIVEEGEDDDGQKCGAPRKAPDYNPPGMAEASVLKLDQPAHHPELSLPITSKQRDRLVALVANSGRTKREVKEWLQRRYGWTLAEQITRAKYDEVCAAIEGRGDLS
jgi:hypothetical protein